MKWRKRLFWLVLAGLLFSNRWVDDTFLSMLDGIVGVFRENGLSLWSVWQDFLREENPVAAVHRFFHFFRSL